MEREGRVIWKFNHNYNADLIVGSKYIAENDPKVLASVCLVDLDPEFPQKVKPGDIVVAGRNFGYGHPHYQGIIALKKAGVAGIIAESFYPLWYRLAVFYAFPALVCKDVSSAVELGDGVNWDLATGLVQPANSAALQGDPMAPFLREIVDAGGFMRYLRQKRAATT